MYILHLILGLVFFLFGFLSIFSKRFDDWLELNIRPKFRAELNLPTARTKSNRNFSRYRGGIGLMTSGLGFTALAIILIIARGM
jgi:hypothetical protein